MYKKYKMESSAMQREDGSTVTIGDRLVCDENRATLRFIGEVQTTKGEWLGVDWEDPKRGKHDGSHFGTFYFKTSHKTSGSFIRPKNANFGVTFMSAVRTRYGRIDDINAGVDVDDLYVVGQNQQTAVEMVGARQVNDLQSKLDELTEIVLRGELIYGSPAIDDLALMVPSIVDLDISQNLVTSWKQVADITVQLKKLRSLNVTDNQLLIPEKPEELVDKFSHITVLYVNRMGYTWPQILQCCDMFPDLQQIHACFNHVRELADVTGRINNIRLVNLESNDIEDWAQILTLGKLPHLDSLILNENSIPEIRFDSNGSPSTDMFSNLTSLSINGNKIASWSSINELNKLEKLEELRIKSNPILTSATNDETTRQLLIAKLKHLKMCNRTKVTSEERKGAEIDYLKRFGRDWVKAGGNQDPNKSKPSPDFVSQHPRYLDFINMWGAPEDSEMQLQSAALKHSLLSVKMVCPALPDKKPIEKKLPQTMTVGKLKALVTRLYKINDDIELTYTSQKMKGQEIELDNDQRFLTYYSIETGDEINIKLGSRTP